MQPYDAYEPCGSCRRHVKRQDAVCPFCGAARTPAQSRAPRRTRNVSRAQWLALGSTLVGIGCTGALGSSGGTATGGPSQDGSTATAPTTSASGAINKGGPDASSAEEASTGDDDATVADAAPEADGNPWGSPDASCPRSGGFFCAPGDGGTCDRATQFCNGTPGMGVCRPLSDLALVATYLSDAGTCGSCPTCACIPPNKNLDQCSCFEDNYGGLSVACSQGGCYGSPPARLDRAPLRAIG